MGIDKTVINVYTDGSYSKKGSIVYCGSHLETTNPSRIYCGKKAQAVPLHFTLSHPHSVVYSEQIL